MATQIVISLFTILFTAALSALAVRYQLRHSHRYWMEQQDVIRLNKYLDKQIEVFERILKVLPSHITLLIQLQSLLYNRDECAFFMNASVDDPILYDTKKSLQTLINATHESETDLKNELEQLSVLCQFYYGKNVGDQLQSYLNATSPGINLNGDDLDGIFSDAKTRADKRPDPNLIATIMEGRLNASGLPNHVENVVNSILATQIKPPELQTRN